MKKLFLILGIFLFSLFSMGQTVIETMHPADADVVLFQVMDSTNADVVICITKDKKKAAKWDCMWKFKEWGFSNFTIFIASDTSQLYMDSTDMLDGEPSYYPPSAYVYFTTYEDERGYRKDVIINGIMRVKKGYMLKEE